MHRNKLHLYFILHFLRYNLYPEVNIQSDYKWSEQFQKFILKKSEGMQKLNLHHWKKQHKKF
jgi:hypothetical protein